MGAVNFDYDSAMFVEYKLREGAVSKEVLEKIENMFWETDYDNGLFAVTYDGDKTVKLVVPYKKGGEEVVWVGIAVGGFMKAMDNAKLLNVCMTTVNEEAADKSLEYNYTGYFEDLVVA